MEESPSRENGSLSRENCPEKTGKYNDSIDKDPSLSDLWFSSIFETQTQNGSSAIYGYIKDLVDNNTYSGQRRISQSIWLLISELMQNKHPLRENASYLSINWSHTV